MLSEAQFREEHDDRFGDRPQRIQRLRAEFRAYAGLDVPRGAAAVRDWYHDHTSVVTKRLSASTESADSADTAEDAGEGAD